MPTTTIRLSETLKERIARVAERSGTTAHAFILSAIAEKAEQAERRSDFHELAEQRYAEILATGETIAWEDMQAYLQDSLAGKSPAKPVARKFK